MVSYRTPREWEVMREAGRVVARTLSAVEWAAEPGISLAELDAVAARSIREMNAKPSFLHYHPDWSPTPYPATVCVSVNEVIVHGSRTERCCAGATWCRSTAAPRSAAITATGR